MSRRLEWAPAKDAELRRQRDEGQTWDAIALGLGVSRNAAIDRARRIGIPPRRAGEAPAAGAASSSPRAPWQPEEDPNRPALSPGHPLAWEILTSGTLLGGTAYPWPPRRDRGLSPPDAVPGLGFENGSGCEAGSRAPAACPPEHENKS